MRFYLNYGKAVNPAENCDYMICPSCASELPPGFRFCGYCGRPLNNPTSTDSPPESPVLVSTPGASTRISAFRSRDERREAVILFADVSGFTSMSERMDPEDVHSVMNEIFDGLGQAIEEQEGYIDKYIGDNIMALFGAPTAHEDDAERACRAALAMQQFLAQFAEKSKFRIGVFLRMRIGLNCGMVFAGGVGSRSRMDYSVMGDAVNLAARLESNAPPGGILVSREVANRARRNFEFGPIQQIKVKGKEKNVEALVLLREIANPISLANDEFCIPFVGREAELDRLVKLLGTARERKYWIEIIGESGIGKTRLVLETAKQAQETKLLPVVVPTYARSQSFSLIKLLVRAVLQSLIGDGPTPKSLDEFAAILKPLSDDLEIYLPSLWYISAPRSMSVPIPDSDPKTVRLMLEKGATLLLQRFSKYRTDVAFFIDSYEFADEASILAIESLVNASEEYPLKMVVTTREQRGRSPRYRTEIHLDRLSQVAARALLDHLIRKVKLTDTVLQDVLRLTDGVPLHIIEIVRSLPGMLSSASEAEKGLGGAKTAIALPASISSAMVSRLDRLGDKKRDLLCQCAAQGVEFDARIADAVRQHPKWRDTPAQELLVELEQDVLVKNTQGFDGSTSYWVFCQPLMREACYQTLPLRDRRELHACIAGAIRDAAGTLIANFSEQLAYHYEGSEQWGCAADAHLLSADRAGGMFFNDQALASYKRAAENIDKIEKPQDTLQIKVKALAGAIRIFLRVGNYADAEEYIKLMRAAAVRPVDQADADRFHATVCVKTGETKQAERCLMSALELTSHSPEAGSVKAWTLFDLAGFYYRAGDMERAKYYLNLHRFSQSDSEGLESMHADILEGKIAYAQGRFPDAAALFTKVHQIAEKSKCMSALANACNNLGNVTRDQGDYRTAYRYFDQALKIYQEIGTMESIAGIHVNMGNLALSQGDLEATFHHHQKSYKVFRAMGNISGIALARINLAIFAIEKNEGRKAIADAKVAIYTLGNSDNALLRGLSLVVLGEGYLACELIDNAEEIFKTIIRDYQKENHQLAIAGSLRGLGRIALKRGMFADAVAQLDRAIEIFEQLRREQETTRSRLYRSEALWRLGEIGRARSELQQAKERFSNMGARLDVDRVSQLLQELSKLA